MSQKKLGYVELEWTCPNCGGRNPGSSKTCQACGAPQPENVQFEQAQGAQLIEDEEKIARAKKGADIHCPYCGTRNPADATSCVQCGGDFSGATRREAGRVVGAFSVQAGPLEPVVCPGCGTENPGERKTCSACGANLRPEAVPAGLAAKQAEGGKPGQKKKPIWLLIPLGIILLLCCGLIALFAFRTDESSGVVQNVAWERAIAIQVLGDVTREAWRDELPSGVEPLSCTEQVRSTESEPAPRSKEICGTPYSVDTGSGFAEVVQDCVYEVYDDYCKYTARDWKNAEPVIAQGADTNPYWPQVQLGTDEREGERSEKYRVFFETADGIKEFTTSDENLFRQLQPGTQWTLELNVFGAVVSVRR